MLHNLSLLTTEELHDLFLKEALHFSEGVNDDLTFDQLKEISCSALVNS
jgi:hypothetical protein